MDLNFNKDTQKQVGLGNSRDHGGQIKFDLFEVICHGKREITQPIAITEMGAVVWYETYVATHTL